MRPFLLVSLIACGDPDVPVQAAPEDAPTVTAVLALDATSAIAGAEVTYTVEVLDAEGSPIEDATWSLSSDLEAKLYWSSTDLRPTVAGTHTLTGTVEVRGLEVPIEAPLEVLADAPYDLDLRLTDHALAAGGEASWEVRLTDRFGNLQDPSAAAVAASSARLVLSDDTLTSTKPGTYLVTARAGDLEDVEVVQVLPGPPAQVQLELSSTALELFETAHASVTVQDAFGNRTDDSWTVSTDRPTATRVSHANVTFYEEGWHTVTVQVDGTSLTDTVGPFLIDSTGPDLLVATPERATWTTQDSVSVTGTAGDDWASYVELTVNGDPVLVSSEGEFATTVDTPFGLTVIESVASDADGNTSRDTRAVLGGSFKTYGSWVDGGVVARLAQGDGGLGTLESLAEGLIAATDLDAMIPSPVVDELEEDTYDPCLGVFGGCPVTVTWYALTAYVRNPSFSSTDLSIDPRSDGSIWLTVTIHQPRLTWEVDATVAEVNFNNRTGTVKATSITARVIVTPRVSGNNLVLDVDSISAWATGFDFGASGLTWLEDALDFFGVDIDAIVRDYLLDSLVEIAEAEVPPALADALSDLELSYDFGLQGRTYTLQARPDKVSVDASGLTLDLETRVTVDSWKAGRSKRLGSLWRGYGIDTWYHPPNTRFGVSGDLVNQVLYATWGGGLLDIEQSASSLGLDTSSLEALFPGVGDLTVTARPLLPPVAVPRWPVIIFPGFPSPPEYDLQVGDLEIVLYNGPSAQGDILIKAYVSAFAGLDVSSNGASTLTADLTPPTFSFDVVVPEASSAAAADTEALLEQLLPLVLPRLSDAIGEIELPSIQGFTVSNVGIGRGGDYNGYVLLGGTLVEQ